MNAVLTKPRVVLFALLMSVAVLLKAQPVADFTMSPPSTGCVPETINFFDQSIGQITSWYWDFGDGTVSTLQNPTHVYVNPGTYTILLLVESGGATDSTTQFLTLTSIPAPSASVTHFDCASGNLGSVVLTNNGGTAPFRYSLDGVNYQSNGLFSNLQIGNYTAYVQDTNGCVSSDTFSVQTTGSIGVDLGPDTALDCGGQQVMLTPVVNGGQAPYTYFWSTGATTASFSTNAAGTYAVTATDANGCSGSDTIMVAVGSSIGANVAASAPTCPNSSDGKAWVTPVGGVPPYDIIWSNGAITDTIYNVLAGIYGVTVTDFNGCNGSALVTVAAPPAMIVDAQVTSDYNGQDISCNGSADGVIVATVSGGNPPYWYMWSSNGISDTIVGVSAGTYSVTVTDINGCTATGNAIVTEPAPISIAGNVTDATCSTCADGAISAGASGGTVPYSYNWSPGMTTSNVANILPGIYTLTVTDANGCTANDSFTVGVDTSGQQGGCTFTVAETINDASCNALDGSVILSVNGGGTAVGYLWSNGDTSASISNIGSGVYTVTITDTGGCSEVYNYTVGNSNSNLSAYAGGSNNAIYICQGESVTLGGTNPSNQTASGGTPPYTYSWTPASGLSNPTVPDPIAMPMQITTYLLEVTDASGCTASDYVIVFVAYNCVWPGDANSDGVADNFDVLSIGLAYGDSSYLRPNASLNWEAQACPDWPLYFQTGANHKHADCDGNGIVNDNDTVAISLNYGLTHSKQDTNGRLSDPALYYDLPTDTVLAGSVVNVPVYFGRDTLPADNVYGIAFTINYDAALVEEGTMNFTPSGSWMGTQGVDLLSYRHEMYVSAKMPVAVVRTDQANISGFGQIGVASFTMKDDISGKNTIYETMNLTFSDVELINKDEEELVVHYEAASFTVSQEEVGIGEQIDFASVAIYPNPASDQLIIEPGNTAIETISLINIYGQEVLMEEDLKDRVVLDVKDVARGTYFIRLHGTNTTVSRRVVIIR